MKKFTAMLRSLAVGAGSALITSATLLYLTAPAHACTMVWIPGHGWVCV